MIPITAVIRPPVRNEIWRGDRFEKSFDGETTLAAMLVESCAMTIDDHRQHQQDRQVAEQPRDERHRIPDRLAVDRRSSPAVTAMPMNEKPVIVSGIAMLCPTHLRALVLARSA